MGTDCSEGSHSQGGQRPLTQGQAIAQRVRTGVFWVCKPPGRPDDPGAARGGQASGSDAASLCARGGGEVSARERCCAWRGPSPPGARRRCQGRRSRGGGHRTKGRKGGALRGSPEPPCGALPSEGAPEGCVHHDQYTLWGQDGERRRREQAARALSECEARAPCSVGDSRQRKRAGGRPSAVHGDGELIAYVQHAQLQMM
mmetsp:Transcript_35368/g.89156  ORF Transcript_35368/g.89156 Transcript_35368/m.89156 type:complete len:201 (+) Transcript_35368:543-1145(+)